MAAAEAEIFRPVSEISRYKVYLTAEIRSGIAENLRTARESPDTAPVSR